MKKFFTVLVVLSIFMSCGSNGNLNKSKGELVGVKGNKFFPEKPYGMVLIPGGSFIMGKSDDDLASVEDAPTKTVTVKSFYMDETEITNSEYRQFVNWVRDSVLRTALAIRAEEVINSDDPASENTDGIREYAFIDQDTSDLSVYDKWKLENDISSTDDEYYAKRKLNWNTDIILEREDYPDLDYLEIVEDFFLNETEVFNDIRTWDVEKFIYRHKFKNLSGEDGYLRKMDERKRDLISALLAEGYDEVTTSGSFPKFVLYKEGTFDIEDEIDVSKLKIRDLRVGTQILEGYGVTEASPAVSVNTRENYKLGSVGKFVTGIDYKIEKIDENNAKFVNPCADVGIYCIRNLPGRAIRAVKHDPAKAVKNDPDGE